MRSKTRHIFLVLFGILLICFYSAHVCFAQKVSKETDDLILVVKLMREEDADFFNRVLRKDDIVFTYGVKPRLLGRIRGPGTMFSRGSVLQIERELKRLKKLTIDYINYDPEQWKDSHTPAEEINNLPEMVERLRRLAEQRDAKLSFATDHILLERYGARIAPMVHIFGIQMQRYQRDSLEEFRQGAIRKLSIVRRGDRDVPVVFQLSLAPPKWKVIKTPGGQIKKVHLRGRDGKKVFEPLRPEIVLEQIEAIKDIADGIALIYTEETRDAMKRLILMLRQ